MHGSSIMAAMRRCANTGHGSADVNSVSGRCAPAGASTTSDVSELLGCSSACVGALVRFPRATRVPSSPAQPCCSTVSSSFSHVYM
jgi:hypothetical protein